MKKTIAALALCLLPLAASADQGWTFEEDARPFGRPAATGRLVNVCLNYDGIISLDWRAKLFQEGDQCKERMLADIDNRKIYFNFDAPISRYTRGRDSGGWNFVRCLDGKYNDQGYTPCNSVFFYAEEPMARFSRYLLNKAEIVKALSTKEVTGPIEDHIRSLWIADYRGRFAAIATSDGANAFAEIYANNDPEGLVAKATEKREKLKLDEYRKDYANCATSADVSRFQAKYQGYDPDGIAKAAEKRRLALMAAEDAAAKRAAAEREQKKRAEALAGLEGQISWCKGMARRGAAALDRDRSIAAISGVYSMSARHAAGEAIVDGDGCVRSAYREYLSLGGRKQLNEIR